MNAVFMELFEEFRDELRLKKRLAARHGHATAVLPVRTEAQRPAHQLVRIGRRAALGQPRIRIMAVDAAQGTALHEYYIAHARPVDRAERLNGMNVAGQSCHSPFAMKMKIKWFHGFAAEPYRCPRRGGAASSAVRTRGGYRPRCRKEPGAYL